MVMKGAFSDVRLTGDGRVKVRGPVQNEDAQVKRMSFVLAQEGVIAEGEARVGSDAWVGEVPAQGFTPGKPVLAVGVAVVVGDDAVQSFTWCEQKQLES